MRFDVSATPEAEAMLAALWMKAADRDAVSRADNAVERFLSTGPKSGTHVAEGLYSIRIPPLTVYYEIHEDDRKVVITMVHAR